MNASPAAKTEAEKLTEGLNPEAVNKIAAELESISAAAKALLDSRLKRETVALLISKITYRPRVDPKSVLAVLDAAAMLAAYNVKPEAVQPRPPPTSVPSAGA